MTQTKPMNPEQGMQRKFSKSGLAAGLALVAAIAGFDQWLQSIPDRQPRGLRVARIAAERVHFDARGFAPFALAGAWRLTSDDPRFGGISALAMDDGRLVALTDSGVVIRFAQSRRAAAIRELPGGPGGDGFKFNRDSEALIADPRGRGWWVAFENRDELWLYDRDFGKALRRIALGDRGWGVNRGIEGATTDGPALLLLHEGGDFLLRVGGGRMTTLRIAGARGRVSEAVDLGGGQWLAVERRLTPFGFRNALVPLRRAGSGYRFGPRITLPLGLLDNLEGAALERLPGGRRRLWLITDDNFRRPMRTLLVALDVPASGVEARRED